jgi:DHA1 family bicyclomycin/chloramphenicol resistance-like MFS transporter
MKEKSMTKKRYIFLVLILGSLTALGPFSIDMYLPGFPSIAKSLHTTTAQVSLTLSGYFIGISVGQLLYGPLLDRFGRKKPLYFGLVLYIAASLCCFFVTSIHQLIVLRFFQAVGSCAASVAAITTVRDVFPVKDNARVFALLILVLSVSPMLAPTVGGYVTTYWGWPFIFLILTSIAILMLVMVIFFLPENYKPDKSYSLKPLPIINSFWSVMKQPQFFTYALCGAIAFSCLYTYLASSPIVFMELYQVKSQVYGWIFALLAAGYIGASQLNGILTRRFQSEQIVKISLPALAIITLVFLAGSAANVLGLYGTIVMVFLLLCCIGITYPNTSALSLATFSKNTGTAASLMGALQMSVGTLVSVLVSFYKSHGTIPMSGLMATAALLALLILIIGRQRIPRPVAADAEEALGVRS